MEAYTDSLDIDGPYYELSDSEYLDIIRKCESDYPLTETELTLTYKYHSQVFFLVERNKINYIVYIE
jgi:hypothetical protein